MDPEPPSFISLLDSTLTTGIVGLLVLLICSALISGAEVALFSLTQKDLDEAKDSKSKSFEIIIELLKQPKKLLATILVANNFINIAIAFALGIALNYVGFTDFLRAPLGANTAKFTITAIITGITYSGILNTPRMYADSWASWQVYNVLKLYQNVLFGNIAYVAKYAFYLINATLAWVVWHRVRNGRDFSKKV